MIRTKRFRTVAGALTLAALAACSSSDDDGGDVPPIALPSGGQSTPINDGLTRVAADAGQVGEDGYVDVVLAEDDVSVLVQLIADDPDKGMLISEIRDPDGMVLFSQAFDLERGEPGPVTSEFFDSGLGNIGSASVFLPPTPALELKAGTYRVSFLTEDDVALDRAEAYIRHAPADGFIDERSLSANLNVWIAHPDEAFRGEAFERTVQTTFKDSINTILAPHALAIGTIDVLRATEEETGRFAVIDAEDDAESAAACRAMQAATTDKLALNLVYARALAFGGDEESGPAGFSPAPGVILDDSSGNACYFVGQTAYVANEAFGFTQALVDQMMAGNILHEAGHFMSLEHPTEENGRDFDQLADTAECDIETFDGRTNPMFGIEGEVDGVISDFECGVDGGADNFLFYSGVPAFLPFRMSMDQAYVIRRHPFFTSAP